MVDDDIVIARIREVVGEQMTSDDFAQIREHLTATDHTNKLRLFPALNDLIRIVKCQEDEGDRSEMAVTLAVTMKYALWNDFDPKDFSTAVQHDLRE